MPTMLTTMDYLISLIVKIFVFLFPIFFLHITSESYEYNKMVLLAITVVILLILFTLKIVRERRFTAVTGTFGLPLFFLSGIAAISTLFQSPNLSVSLTTPISTTAIVSGFLLYLLLVNILADDASENHIDPPSISLILVFDAVLLCLYVIGMYTDILPKNFFTPAGSLLSTAIFLAIIAIYLLNRLIRDILIIKMGGTSIILYSLALLIIAGTAIFLAIHLFTDQKPVILPWSFGWPIFMEVAKNARTLFLGIGSANFLTAFTLAKPFTFNQSPFWNTVFTSSSSFVLNLATENGIISALLYIFLLFSAVNQSIRRKISGASHYNYLIPLLAALIFQMIFPTSTAIFTLTVVLLAFAATKKTLFTLDIARLGRLNYLLLFIPVSLILAFSYFGGRAYLAEVSFKASLDALLNKDGTAAYNYQKAAIGLNPYLDRYHVAFSQTNLSLANTLASKEKLTDSDKQNIPRFIQQSIDQARTAVLLYKTNIVNWDNLAKTYTALINFVSGSDTWAIYAYQQKIILDPLNPQNHVVLGGIYTQMKKYPEAEAEYQQAIKLKSDLASAYYNLGLTLSNEQKYKEAKQAFTTTLTLLPIGSNDSKTVNDQLLKLNDLLPQEEATFSAIHPADPEQTLELNPTPPSALQNLPTPLPAISLPQPPAPSN